MLQRIKTLWNRKGGYRELLVTAFPLIISTATWSVMQFTDRIFLTWYSPDAVAASMPAGMLNFTLTSLFIGTAGYVGTFVAQYYGAKQYGKIGASLWQGIYLSLTGSALVAAAGFAAAPFFDFIGHSPDTRRFEILYFSILCFGSIGPITSSVFSGFFSGMGRNFPVMGVNITAAVINIVLDWLLIFGRFGFPELGVAGAAIATVIAGLSPVLIFGFLIFAMEKYRGFGTHSCRFDRKLFARILRFGLPSGVHMFIDVAGFTVFLLIVGRLGTTELAATNIALNINSIAFMPMIGFGIAISMITGQNIGRGDIATAERSIWAGFQLCFTYMSLVAATYFFFPEIYIFPFASQADPARFAAIGSLAVVLLKFVALYSLFDTLNMVFASAIKGAGDTRFVMLIVLVLSICGLIIPSYIAVAVLHKGIIAVWVIASAYISVLGISYFIRFLSGRWKHMKVIEHVPSVASGCPDVPYIDL
jgi:MATE family multidrug resistance protein